jgi:hypothetical protein
MVWSLRALGWSEMPRLIGGVREGVYSGCRMSGVGLPCDSASRGSSGRRTLVAALALLCLGVGPAICPPTASARPLVAAPAPLVAEASQPCVFYSCAANPQPHINWENSLGPLPTNYCTLYVCKPMDLVPDHGFDDNLLPFNPDWAYFVENGRAPDANQLCGQFEGALSCTSQPVEYDAPGVDTVAYFVCPAGRGSYFSSFHGHVNWEPATYEGTLSWESHSAWYEDDDYSIDLKTPNRAGATAARLEGIHLEFDSDETIDHFDSSPWWHQFHKKVDHSDAAAAGAINGHLAVVTGLVGLDTAHSVSTESHPVYAMAIQTDRQSALAGGTDRWAIFARNWGNEGYCSQHNHTLPPGPLTVRIPWLKGATGVRAVLPGSSATQVALTGYELHTNINHEESVALRVIPGQGVLFTFDLSTPASREPLYWGTIDLKWTFSPPAAVAQSASGPAPESPLASGRSAAASNEGEKSDVESKAGRLFRRLPRTTRLRALALFRRRLVALAVRPVRSVQMAMGGPLVAPLRTIEAFVSPPLSPAFVAQGKAQRAALCVAYKNRVPGYRTMCRSTKRKAARPKAR